MGSKTTGWWMGAALTAPLGFVVAAPPPAPQVGRLTTNAAEIQHFESKIRPLLLDRCGKCHGAKVQQAALRLDTLEGLRKGSDRGPIIDLAKPDQSSLLKAVRHEGSLRMPPAEKLPEAEIAALTAWVKQGAPWPMPAAGVGGQGSGAGKAPNVASAQHWSFRPVRRPTVPRVKNASWVRTPIDAFILARLEAKGLKPSPPADRRTLIRRAAYDLTGLPPTPEEIRDFLADRSPDAFAKVVDRLLAAPAYGERWGRHWLDIARYADSKDVRDLGQPYDIVESYRYRDWVIRALNADLPYDQFITHQLAGDLLPSPHGKPVNADGITATTFLTIGGWGPGDADLQKMYTDMVDDQVNAVSRTFLGLTVGCARCHDHKFDPISTADYYGLAGIFFSTQIAVPQISAPYNKVPLIPQAEIDARQQYLARIPEMEKAAARFVDRAYAELPKRFIGQTEQYLMAAWDLRHAPAASRPRPEELAAQRGLRGDALVQLLRYLEPAPPRTGLLTRFSKDTDGRPGVHAVRGNGNEPVVVVNTTDQTMHVPGTMPPHTVTIHPGPTTGIGAVWTSPIKGSFRVRGRIADAHQACGDGADWGIERVRSGGVEPLVSGGFEDGGASELAQAVDAARLEKLDFLPGDQLRIVVLPKQNHGCDLTLIDVRLEELGGENRTWSLADDLAKGPFPRGSANPHADRYGHPGVWSFYDMGQASTSVHADLSGAGALAAWLAAPDHETAAVAAAAVQRALQDPSASESPTAVGRLWRELASGQGPFRLAKRDNDTLLPPDVLSEKKHREQELAAYKTNAPEPVPYAMGAKEGGVPGTKYAGFNDARIHIRGRYDRLGEVVPRRFPLVLAGQKQAPIKNGSGRLELARWIAGASHPLTGRVLVNRVWQHHFGEGLVRTPGNFGKLGDLPTHPELLDYLAAVFTSGGTVNPAQGSKGVGTPITTAASGAAGSEYALRITQYGGLGWSLKRLHRLIMLSSAYQQASAPRTDLKSDPENRLWARANVRRLEAEAIRDTFLAVSGKLDRTLYGPPLRRPGEDALSPRRAVYLMANRSDKTGFRFVFDAADPENIVDQRTVSTVAPQALFLMNDPFALEQTRALADRLLARDLLTDTHRITDAYERLYGRQPRPAEIALGLRFVERRGSDEAARRAAWIEYCQVLLCANELIYLD